MPALDQLGRRERQIMSILYRLGRASASEVQEALDEPLSNSGVRSMLRHLAGKGYVVHEQDGPRYLYHPVAEPDEVSRSALQQLVNTFFRNSPSSAIAALLHMNEGPLPEDEYRRLSELLEQAREPQEGQ
jgi:predicted transcriptional regulator